MPFLYHQQNKNKTKPNKQTNIEKKYIYIINRPWDILDIRKLKNRWIKPPFVRPLNRFSLYLRRLSYRWNVLGLLGSPRRLTAKWTEEPKEKKMLGLFCVYLCLIILILCWLYFCLYVCLFFFFNVYPDVFPKTNLDNCDWMKICPNEKIQGAQMKAW